NSAGLGQLEYTVDFEGRVTAYRYDNTAEGGGRLVGKHYYNSLNDYNTDNANGPLDMAAQSITYKYDGLGRLVETNDSAFGTLTKQAYDAEGRLIQIASSQGFLNYSYNNL